MTDIPPADPLPSSPAEGAPPGGPADRPSQPSFGPGEPIELLELGKAPFLLVLRPGAQANVRGHRFAHDALIGAAVGSRVRSPQGGTFALVRPTLARWVESMPRFTNAIYPKDAGPILLYADLFPGARVLEAGIGSGGLALAVLRAIGPGGRLISCDVRQESLTRGRSNVAAWFGGPHPAHTLREADVYEGLGEVDLDRVLLDLPEPWRVVPHARRALRPGGLLAAFLPTALQVHELVNALRDSGEFWDIDTLETLQRRWRVGRRSVRPETQMIGHTGFVTVARFVPGAEEAPGAAAAPEA